MQSTKQIPVAIHSSVKYSVSQIDDDVTNCDYYLDQKLDKVAFILDQLEELVLWPLGVIARTPFLHRGRIG